MASLLGVFISDLTQLRWALEALRPKTEQERCCTVIVKQKAYYKEHVNYLSDYLSASVTRTPTYFSFIPSVFSEDIIFRTLMKKFQGNRGLLKGINKSILAKHIVMEI